MYITFKYKELFSFRIPAFECVLEGLILHTMNKNLYRKECLNYLFVYFFKNNVINEVFIEISTSPIPIKS